MRRLLRGQPWRSHRAQTSSATSDTIPDRRRRGVALLWGIGVWVVVFAAAFSVFWYLCFHLVQNALLAYVGLWTLPQLMSSVGGAVALVVVRRTFAGARSLATVFAVATCVISAFVGVLCVLLALKDMPEGLEFLGWLAAIFGIVLIVDVLLVAVLASAFVTRLARRYMTPEGGSRDHASV